MIPDLHIGMITELNMTAATKTFDWWYDSNATVHVCNDKSQFKTFEKVIEGYEVMMKNNDTTKVLYKGTIEISFTSKKKLVLVNVLFVPEIRKNLVSSNLLCKKGITAVLESDKVVFLRMVSFLAKVLDWVIANSTCEEASNVSGMQGMLVARILTALTLIMAQDIAVVAKFSRESILAHWMQQKESKNSYSSDGHYRGSGSNSMEFPSLSFFLHFYFLLLSYLSMFLLSGAQQNYVGLDTTNCGSNNSVTFGYLCNGPQISCSSYLTFRSTYPYDTLISISNLLASDASQIAQVNKMISEVDKIPTGTLIIVPVNCSCLGNFYQHNTSYTLNSDDTYFSVANNTYQGLTTCQALMNQNPYDSQNLLIGSQLLVPLRCACATSNQTASGVSFLLTYLVTWGDFLSSIAAMFGVNTQTIINANDLSSPILYPFTPILVPLNTEPKLPSPAPQPPAPPVSPTPSVVPAGATPMAKGGCQETCGNISIPFPFGIGNGCYFDPRFEILCNESNSNPSVTFLQYPDLDVLEFLPDFAVRVVYTSVASTRRQGNNTQLSESIDFPFTFSVTHNNFIAIGCDIGAQFTRINSGQNSIGCMSVCANNTLPTLNSSISSCSGDGCCSTPIPSNVQLFDVNIYSLGVSGASNSCGLAFLADNNFTEYNQFYLSGVTDVLNSTNYRIPVVLDWVIANSTCEEASKDIAVVARKAFKGIHTYLLDAQEVKQELQRF
ncbi:hypothetical protein NE237_002834 [Protea cynaroides]|uniref:LysM domain-containing protein n=1 Tax=Protea cynaroides TaxID=273540 RepID=A0A9Q0QS09_9MAGN|nr:hypothetical protein NE237_002834 [Protea cynaroides]